MTQNNKLEALTSADMIEYKGKLYTPMERLSLLMEKAMNEGTKPIGERTPGERCMYEIQRAETMMDRKIKNDENKRRVERMKKEDDGK